MMELADWFEVCEKCGPDSPADPLAAIECRRERECRHMRLTIKLLFCRRGEPVPEDIEQLIAIDCPDGLIRFCDRFAHGINREQS